MPAYKFPYYRVSYTSSRFFYKFKNLPLIKIGLLKDGRVTKPESFIDTGSQYCMFNNAYAKYLGISNYKDVPDDHIMPIMGIGGRSACNTAFFHTVDLLIYSNQKHLEQKNAIIAKDVEVAFLEKEFDVGGILGVYGFLDRFVFKTNIQAGFFELEPLFEA